MKNTEITAIAMRMRFDEEGVETTWDIAEILHDKLSDKDKEKLDRASGEIEDIIMRIVSGVLETIDNETKKN